MKSKGKIFDSKTNKAIAAFKVFLISVFQQYYIKTNSCQVLQNVPCDFPT